MDLRIFTWIKPHRKWLYLKCKNVNRDCRAFFKRCMELIAPAKEERRRHWFIYERVSLSAEGPATWMCAFAQNINLCRALLTSVTFKEFFACFFSLFIQKTLICSQSSRIWPPPPRAIRELCVPVTKSPESSPWATAHSWSPFPTAPTRYITESCPATPTPSWIAFPRRRISKRYRETMSTRRTARSISWVAVSPFPTLVRSPDSTVCTQSFFLHV